MKGDKFKNLTVFYDYGEVDKWYIEDFEKRYGYTLPNTYKKLMLKYNGASFYESTFALDEEKFWTWSFIFDAFGEKEDVVSHIEETQLSVQNPDYYGIPGLICIASTGEGDLVCFDYRDDLKGNNPKVVVMIHDEYDKHDDESLTNKVTFIANSFDDFLNMLYEEE